MTDFENKMLQELLIMKKVELLSLMNDKKCKLKKDALEELASNCESLQSHIYFVDTWKYEGFK